MVIMWTKSKFQVFYTIKKGDCWVGSVVQWGDPFSRRKGKALVEIEELMLANLGDTVSGYKIETEQTGLRHHPGPYSHSSKRSTTLSRTEAFCEPLNVHSSHQPTTSATCPTHPTPGPSGEFQRVQPTHQAHSFSHRYCMTRHLYPLVIVTLGVSAWPFHQACGFSHRLHNTWILKPSER